MYRRTRKNYHDQSSAAAAFVIILLVSGLLLAVSVLMGFAALLTFVVKQAGHLAGWR